MWYSQSLRQVLWGARELRAVGLCTGPPALDGPLGGGAACRRGDSSALPVATGLLLLQHGRFLLICSVMKGPVQLCGSNGRKTLTEHCPKPASGLSWPCVGSAAAGSGLPTTGAGGIPATPGNHASRSYPLCSCRASPPVLKNYKQRYSVIDTGVINTFFFFFCKHGISGKIFLTGHKIAD